MRTAAIAISLVTVLAQTRPAPRQTRDNTPPPVGTASISGRVVADDASNQPLHKATVTLGSGGLQLPQTTMTDDTGRYRFTGVVHGSYTIAATRPAYVPAFYGSKKTGKGPGIPIAVPDGAQVTGIDLRLMRGSVISGIIRSANGVPTPGIEVQVIPVQSVNGVRQMSSSIAALIALAGGATVTDDRGAYRAYGLAPGDYIVQSQPAPLAEFRGAELRQVTPEEVQWAQQATAQSPAGIVSAAAPALPPLPDAGRTVTYAPVYYPGTALAADAVLVTVGPGEERQGIDFSRQLVPTAKVTGAVLDPNGQPLEGVQVTVRASDTDVTPDFINMMMGGNSGRRTAADGTFTVPGMRPGRYQLTARGGPRQQGRQATNPLEAMLGGQGGMGGGDLGALMGLMGNAQPWWARQEITVDGRDIADLTLRLQPGMTISGRVVFEGGAPPPEDITKIRLSFGAVPTSASPFDLTLSGMTGGNLATIVADGTFAAKGIVPGRYRGSLNSGSSMILAMFTGGAQQLNNWTLKSIIWKGRDIADVPLDVKPNEDVADVVVTLTDRPTEISGTVSDQTGHATGNFPIVVFSTDKAYWTIGSRRVQSARPASDGQFKISGLPPGEYFVMAVTELDAAELYNPAFLEQLSAASAYRIQLADGQKLIQNLKLQ